MRYGTLAWAADEARKVAAQHRITMVLVQTKDDWGKPIVEFCPESHADILYGVQLKYGLATIIDRVKA